MTNVKGVSTALLEFVATIEPDTTLLLPLKIDELAVLHSALTTIQSLLEKSGTSDDAMKPFGRARQKVEKALSQAGYGGDPR